MHLQRTGSGKSWMTLNLEKNSGVFDNPDPHFEADLYRKI